MFTNLHKIVKISPCTTGPRINKSLSDLPLDPFAEALNTTRTLVVELDVFTTG